MNGETQTHAPVLVEELLDALVTGEGGTYVDCTFGRGGHAAAVLRRAGPRARVLGLDRDPEAVRAGRELAATQPGLSVVHARFSRLASVVQDSAVTPDGIYFDLGVSSPQLDRAQRGFSFLRDGPLDMRMDPGAGESAAQWLAHATASEIEGVLREYGEERYARRIARAIVLARRDAPLETTFALAEVVTRAMPAAARHAEPGQHPTTRCFQAIRMQVNDERRELSSGLQQALEVLQVGGRLVVISFHSGEDRIVKRFLRDASRPPMPSRHAPVPANLPPPRLTGVSKLISAGAQELARNPRARSARLRHAQKCR